MKTNANKSNAALAARPSGRHAVSARPNVVSAPRLARPGPIPVPRAARALPAAGAVAGRSDIAPAARGRDARLEVTRVRSAAAAPQRHATRRSAPTGVRAGAAAAPRRTPSATSRVAPSGVRSHAAVSASAAPTVVRAAEPRSTPSSPASHSGRGDATLARYMTELSGHELLGRDEEIALAREVERLEIAYWRALFALPRATPALCAAIEPKLEEPPQAELKALTRAAAAASSSTASRTSRTRYTNAVERAATKLRELDVHREAIKQAHQSATAFANSLEAGRGARAGVRSKAVETYLRDTERARCAQQAAKDRFVAANLRLVVSMARRYAREGRMPLADLIQEGNLGLIKAVERFDHRRGFRFSTYASWWIRHALTRGLADKGRLVRLPVHALETRARLTRAARKIMCRTGEAPSQAELAAETGLPPDKLIAAEELSIEAPFSLDVSVGADNDRTFLDMLRYEDQPSAEDNVLNDSHKQSLTALMNELSPFEAQILRFRYGFGGDEERTLKEIGQMYNLSRERIRQIQAGALAKMRTRAESADAERAAL